MHETKLHLNHRLVEAERTLHATPPPPPTSSDTSPSCSTRSPRRMALHDCFVVSTANSREDELPHGPNGRNLPDRIESLCARIDSLNDRIDVLARNLTGVADAGQQVREDFAPHIDTLAWLLGRVETIRAEMLHELRYGRDHGSSTIESIIVRPEALAGDDVRLNLGCGHLPLDGYVNVDMRQLPGVDIVAPVDDLPVEPSRSARSSAHTCSSTSQKSSSTGNCCHTG